MERIRSYRTATAICRFVRLPVCLSAHFLSFHLQALDDNTKREYGYSYMLGWISVGLGAISAILFLCASFAVQPARRYREEKELPPYGYGNEAFDNPYPTYPVSAPGYGAQSYYGYGY